MSDRNSYDLLRRTLVPVLKVSVAISAIAMICILALGIWSLFTALFDFVAGTGPKAADTIDLGAGLPKKVSLLVTLVKGIELIFVAPLPFLLTLSVTRYTEALLIGQDTQEALAHLTTVKLIISALFISITAAHMLVEFIGPTVRTAVDFAPMLGLIAVLTAYVFVLESRSHQLVQRE